MTRYALIEQPSRQLDQIRAYMPGNYAADWDVDGNILIHGEDVAGWTLDDYVIPRLASGLHFAREIDTPTEIAGEVAEATVLVDRQKLVAEIAEALGNLDPAEGALSDADAIGLGEDFSPEDAARFVRERFA